MSQPVPSEVEGDLACVGCGYNLRMLSIDGNCPECFTPIGNTLRGNLLKFSDPGWLDRIRLGMVVKLWNLLAGFLMGFAIAIAVVFLPSVFSGLLTIVVSFLGCWATFLITTQDPRAAFDEDPVTWRRALRFFAVIGVLGTGVMVATWPNLQFRNQVFPSILALISPIVLFGELTYFQGFANRIPNARLVRQCGIVKWGASASMALHFGAQLVLGLGWGIWTATFGAGGAAMPGTPQIIIIVSSCTFGLGMLIFGIWHIILLIRFYIVFRDALGQARALASGNPADPISGPALDPKGGVEGQL